MQSLPKGGMRETSNPMGNKQGHDCGRSDRTVHKNMHEVLHTLTTEGANSKLKRRRMRVHSQIEKGQLEPQIETKKLPTP